jgi:LAS superfamily LD-carboxypeptidase LdcB
VARELPVERLRFPVGLLKAKNGELADELLAPVKPYGRLYAKTAAIAWAEMRNEARKSEITLRPTSTVDTYRPLSVQRAVFLQRYSEKYIPGARVRRWNGTDYYQRPGVAMAAVPGTSNHGWGLACDIWNVGQNGRLEWLLDNAKRFGFSWEVQSEPWHIRYVLGDDLP